MLLSRLLRNVEIKAGKISECDISFITDDSRNVTENSVFVCIDGAGHDGHAYAAEAVRNGARAVICEKSVGEGCEILVADSRRAYSLMCSEFFGRPSEKLKLIGITGTNGKTTTAFLLKEILESAGKKCGLVGTVCDMAGGSLFSSERTTPDPFELHCLFAKMAERGCEYCIMEVSSQALSQGRVAALNFEIAVFTNLTVDHLDYHGTLEKYKSAKKQLFFMTKTAIINADDPSCDYMCEGIPAKILTYSAKKSTADYFAENIAAKESSVEYDLKSEDKFGRVKVPIPGSFTVYNSMAAAVCALLAGTELKTVTNALSACRGVKGRAEAVPTPADFTVIIDYAHTPDGLENILKAVRGFAAGRIITVFGCGGDRDKSKRPIMGEISERLSDYVIITSDNPRTEKPWSIIEDILTGFSGKNFEAVENRREAIFRALSYAKSGDTVLLAGKGHEAYQVIGREKIHFDEREIIAEYFDRKGSL